MDLYCPRCGEPWDNDCIHEEASARSDEGAPRPLYRDVVRDFQANGCVALAHIGGRQCEQTHDRRALAASVAYEVLGDDMDGAAAMLEDFDLFMD